MKKVLVFVLGLSLVLTLVSCPPRYSGEGKANIYIGKEGVNKTNAVVGEVAPIELTVKLENATFVEERVTKGLDISKWFTLKNLDKEGGDKATVSAKVLSVSDSHINKSDKKLLDTLVASVSITSQKEGDGNLSIEVPAEYFTLSNPTKESSKKSIAGSNNITVVSKDKYYVKAVLDKTEVVSNYTFGQTDKKEAILILKNATFKDEVLNNSVLSDSSKYATYFKLDLSDANVVDNYSFAFALNGARKDSIKLLITSETLMREPFEVKDLPITISVLKGAYTPNQGASIKTDRLDASFKFTKTPEGKSSATINCIEGSKLITSLDLTGVATKDVKMLITLASDSFNKALLTQGLDISKWFSLSDSEHLTVESATVDSIQESPISRNEKEKIYTQLYCNVKLATVKVHENGKNTTLSVAIPSLIDGKRLFTRAKMPLSVANGINITVVK